MSGQSPRLRAGIIAAGHGVRLRSGGHAFKPLVPVAGITLVERVLASLAEAAPSEVTIIVNEEATAVRDHVSSRVWPFSLRWIIETTPSSMHSFLRLIQALAAGGDEGPFLISTVDTIAARGAFKAFAAESRTLDADVTVAITRPTDDDNPLLVNVASGSSRVTAIGAAAAGSSWATAGYYCARPSVLQEADEAQRDGIRSLRTFFGRLHDRGYKLAGVPVADGVDVDRPGDVSAAEKFLKQVGV